MNNYYKELPENYEKYYERPCDHPILISQREVLWRKSACARKLPRCINACRKEETIGKERDGFGNRRP